MNKKLSFKGIILGAIADVGGSNIWGLILVLYLIFHYQIYTLPTAQQSVKLQSLIMRDPILIVLNIIIGGGFSILGGYLAARIAKHNELLNGTLSSFLCVIFSFFAINSSPILNVLIGILVNPLLGLIGGHLRLWEHKTWLKHKKEKVS